MKRTLMAAVALVAASALAACSSSGGSGKTDGPTPSGAGNSAGSVKVGSADFPESTLLAYIYGGAMAAKGVKVSMQVNIGERPVYMTALKQGAIGMVPEYTGSILDYLDPSATAQSPSGVYTALQDEARKNAFALANYAPAQDKDTITVTKQTAAKYKLSSIADLAPVAKKLTLGAPAQFETRSDGIPGLKRVYGVTFGRFTPTAAGGTVTVDALKNGSIQAADIFSTDPSIIQNGFVSLQDPKNMFGAQNIVPLFRQQVMTKTMTDACNAVSAKLDTTTLAQLDTQVAEGKNPQTVAQTWLSSHGLRST